MITVNYIKLMYPSQSTSVERWSRGKQKVSLSNYRRFYSRFQVIILILTVRTGVLMINNWSLKSKLDISVRESTVKKKKNGNCSLCLSWNYCTYNGLMVDCRFSDRILSERSWVDWPSGRIAVEQLLNWNAEDRAGQDGHMMRWCAAARGRDSKFDWCDACKWDDSSMICMRGEIVFYSAGGCCT